MSPRAAGWLAWSLCAFSLALTALSLLLLALNLSHPDAHVYEFWDGTPSSRLASRSSALLLPPAFPPIP